VCDTEIVVAGFYFIDGICCKQEKQAENKRLQQRADSLEKTVKDLKTKLEYVLSHVKNKLHICSFV